MIKPVTLAPEAEAQVRAVDAWWRSERPLAPNLFVDELAEALERSRRVASAAPQRDRRAACARRVERRA